MTEVCDIITVKSACVPYTCVSDFLQFLVGGGTCFFLGGVENFPLYYEE